jgi:hypothetical protein
MTVRAPGADGCETELNRKDAKNAKKIRPQIARILADHG